jgi:hypothetical protein
MDKPYTVEKVKSAVGRVTGFCVRQGERTWYGKTAKEAEAAREADIAQACQERHDPIVLSNQEDTWIGWFQFPHGWSYDRIRTREKDGRHHIYGSGQYKTRAECERTMRRHVAQCSYKIGDGPDFPVLDDAMEFLRSSTVDPYDVASHLIDIAWQRGAKMAKAKGYAVNVSHESPGDKIADGMRRAESDRVYALIRKRRESGGYIPGFCWIDYLRGDK